MDHEDDQFGPCETKQKKASSVSPIKKQRKKRGPRGSYKKKGKATEIASSTTQGGFAMHPNPFPNQMVGTTINVHGIYVPILFPAASAPTAAIHGPGTTTTAPAVGLIPVVPRPDTDMPHNDDVQEEKHTGSPK